MTEQQAIERMAQELQSLLSDVAGIPAYYLDAPRDDAEGIAVKPPFLVYEAAPRAPDDESGEWSFDLFLDVWALDSTAKCFEAMSRLDAALNGEAFELESGTMCADRNGALFQRHAQDPDDERIRRMRGQYLIRFNARQH